MAKKEVKAGDCHQTHLYVTSGNRVTPVNTDENEQAKKTGSVLRIELEVCESRLSSYADVQQINQSMEADQLYQ